MSIKTVSLVAGVLLLLHALPAPMSADEAILSLDFADRIRVSERSNLSRSEDGRYVGLTNRQVTGYLTREETSHRGRMLVFEETLRDLSLVGRRVDASFPGMVTASASGGFVAANRVPRYLGIPALPASPVAAGDAWSASGRIVVALPHGVPPVELEVEVSYRYAGMQQFNGEPVHILEAEFATRYPPPPDPDAPEGEQAPLRDDILRIAGRHSLGIQIPAGTSAPFLIRDRLEEQYRLAGAPVTTVRGHTLLFVYGLSAEEQREIAADISARLRESRTESVTVEQTNTGTRITMQNIRFVPDQAVILPEERGRLGSIAEALATLPDTRFLVVGHTADVGGEESQESLSWERARVIVEELVALGMDASRFDLEGRGGSDPVAPNDTEEGRAKNRRVEIYVLEE